MNIRTTSDAAADDVPALQREIARLREDNEHLRASAIWWRKLYETAVQGLGALAPAAETKRAAPGGLPFFASHSSAEAPATRTSSAR